MVKYKKLVIYREEAIRLYPNDVGILHHGAGTNRQEGQTKQHTIVFAWPPEMRNGIRVTYFMGIWICIC